MLTDEECGQLFKALMHYVREGAELETGSLPLKLMFSVFKSQIDENGEKWEQIREKRSIAAKKRWEKNNDTQDNANDANASKCIQSNANDAVTVTDTGTVTVTDTGTVTVTDTGTVTVTDTGTVTGTVTDTVTGTVYNNTVYSNNESIGEDKSSPPPTQNTRFKKPTLEQVEAYCCERNNGIDAERFYDYYEANGWKVGKNSMKDWKAAVRKWERNEYSTKKPDTKIRDENDPMNEGFV